MEEYSQFSVRQIVWAKAGNYPWWPAKIVNSLTQQHRKLFKVNFFGDPTYCYLEHQQLLTFEAGLARSKSESDDFKLEKPVQLAKAAQRKIKPLFELPLNHRRISEKSSQILDQDQECEEEAKVEEKCFEEKIEKMDIDSTCRFQQTTNTSFQPSFQQITTDNVIDILAGTSFRSLQLLKGYNNRKQFRQINQKLKAKLLQKYKLHAYLPPQSKVIQRAEPLMPRKRIFIRKIKHRKQKKSGDVLRELSAKKLYKMLKRKIGTGSRGLLMSMMEKLRGCEGDKKKYRQIFKSLIMMIRSEDSEFEESERKDDEQKTKLTQLID